MEMFMYEFANGFIDFIFIFALLGCFVKLLKVWLSVI